ncbi:MAG: hypothetical protein LIP08_10790 [Bacteroides sp.]|nr:hypothetical protein [Bacteroides sp.]
MITLYDKTGKEFLQVPLTDAATRKRQLMGDNYVLLVCTLPEYIEIRKGCYILYEGFRFQVTRNVYPEQESETGGWRYEIYFDAVESLLKKYTIFYRRQGVQEAGFSLTTNLLAHAQIVADCINHELGAENWQVKDVPEELREKVKSVSYKGEKLYDALTLLADAYECEWWTEENGNAVHICFGKLGIGSEVEFRTGEIVTSIPRRAGDSSSYGTRFYCYGSTRNLTSSYGQAAQGGSTNHISEIRLRLPGDRPYLDAWDDLEPEDVVHQVVFFDDIYPKNTDTVTGVETKTGTVEGSDDTFDVYVMSAANTPFTPAHRIARQTLGCVFTSGALEGWEFELHIDEKNFDRKFEIIHQTIGSGDRPVIVPNASMRPWPDDTFILTGVELPEERIREAEEELLEAGRSWALKNSRDTDVYECPTNPVYCTEHELEYELGQRVLLADARFGEKGRSSRIQGYEKKLCNPHEATYTVGDNTAYSRLGAIESHLKEADYAERIGVNGSGVYLIGKHDATQPTDYNAYSALRASVEYLHKNKIDSAQKLLHLLEGAKFGDFIPGPLGGGAYIDEHGNAEMTSLTLRAFLEAPEFRYNRIQVVGGELYATNGSVISGVQEDDGSYLITLKIEEGDHIPFVADDILLGSYLRPEGFFSSYMRVIQVNDTAHTIRCILGNDAEVPGGVNRPPVPFMNLVQYGNFTDASRQSSIRISSKDKCITMLDGVDTYLTGSGHIAFGLGAARNFPLPANLPIHPDQSYLYARGIAVQDLHRINYEGKAIQEIEERGVWSWETAHSDTPYRCTATLAHDVWHRSCRYRCIVDKTRQEPRWNATDWLLIAGNPNFTIDIESSNGLDFDYGEIDTTLSVRGWIHYTDVTDQLLDTDISWTRDSGDTREDDAWAMARASYGRSLPITTDDVGGLRFVENGGCRFICTAWLRDGNEVTEARQELAFGGGSK